jgi:lysozyme
MKASERAYTLIKVKEGFKAKQYTCPAGLPTIGYGHVLLKGESYAHLPEGISEHFATLLLEKAIHLTEKCIDNLVTVALTQGQYDALISLVYNIGCKQFSNSHALKLLNEHKYEAAAHELFSEEKGFVNIKDTKSPGLINRRAVEYKIWLSTDNEAMIC